VHRARALCDEENLLAKLVFLMDVLRQNGFDDRQIHRVIKYHSNIRQPENKPNSVAFLPYVKPTFNQINMVLSDTTSSLWAYHTRKYLISTGLSKTT
jgi:hypothetical protein